MSDAFSLAGKNALVTGATRGIGLAIAGGFLRAGANVVICGRKQEGVDQAVEKLGGSPDKLLGVAAHLGQKEGIDRLLAAAEANFDPIHILVNNAGTNPYYGPIAEAEDWAWDKTMDVNLKAPYLLSKALYPGMAAAGSGSIINIASTSGLAASHNQGIYSVSKAGLIMLTKAMAKEMGASGVRVNCICPGLIKTHLSKALWADEKVLKKVVSIKALKRIGSPEEVVGAAVYFASDAGSFTTGAVLRVDGGMVI